MPGSYEVLFEFEMRLSIDKVSAAPELIRDIPYPYHCIMAICSDLDNTPDWWTYMETLRFLNSDSQTSLGKGLAIEVGNTIYFDMPAGHFSYWNTDDAGRQDIRKLIHSGHIDCIHSYGESATSRYDAMRCLDELSRHNCKLEVWIDHATAPTNFGADIMQGQGDIPGSEAYHADLTFGYGIRFAWLGRVTSVIGQDVHRSLKCIWRKEHNWVSSQTILKEWAKGILGAFGNAKYRMHWDNQVIRQNTLRDGRIFHEFMRCNPHPAGVSCGDNADGLSEVLVPTVLERLVQTRGFCILYTHLGKANGRSGILGASTIQALERLADYYHQGKILVGTTRRILNYCLMKREISVSRTLQDGYATIAITAPQQLSLDGLTIYSDTPVEKIRITVNGRTNNSIYQNPPDHTGKRSLSFPWKRLEFPEL